MFKHGFGGVKNKEWQSDLVGYLLEIVTYFYNIRT